MIAEQTEQRALLCCCAGAAVLVDWHTAAQAEFCMTSEAGGGIGGRLQSYAGLDGDIYLRGGGGPEATGVLNTGRRLAVWVGRWMPLTVLGAGTAG